MAGRIRFAPGMLLVMVLALLGPARAALCATHIVKVRNFQFDPDSLTIAVGDVVQWEWESGTHTTTSGLSSNPADNPGVLWDEPLSLTSPVFSFLFAGEGTFPYFCRPHELAGMKGVIIVSPDVSVDRATWSKIKALFMRKK